MLITAKQAENRRGRLRAGGDREMLKLALIGKDVSKSDSAKMHGFIMRGLGEECSYELISCAAEDFDAAAKKLLSDYDAFNVTIPYKLDIIPYLKKTEGDAKVFGAVNTVKDGIGYNTDGIGFSLMLENNGISVKGKKVLALGAGGAGRSVVKKLLDAGADVWLYDLRRENAEAVCAEFKGVHLAETLVPQPYFMAVNMTGVGMHKTEGISPVQEDILANCEAAVDLIYFPKKSEFLRIAESLGKKTVNGEGMLFYQAYYADCIYLGREPSAEEAKTLFEKYTEEML